jgi:hypothetical protein
MGLSTLQNKPARIKTKLESDDLTTFRSYSNSPEQMIHTEPSMDTRREFMVPNEQVKDVTRRPVTNPLDKLSDLDKLDVDVKARSMDSWPKPSFLMPQDPVRNSVSIPPTIPDDNMKSVTTEDSSSSNAPVVIRKTMKPSFTRNRFYDDEDADTGKEMNSSASVSNISNLNLIATKSSTVEPSINSVPLSHEQDGTAKGSSHSMNISTESSVDMSHTLRKDYTTNEEVPLTTHVAQTDSTNNQGVASPAWLSPTHAGMSVKEDYKNPVDTIRKLKRDLETSQLNGEAVER